MFPLKLETDLSLECSPHHGAVGVLVALRPESSDCGTLARIELTYLDLSSIRVASHLATESV